MLDAKWGLDQGFDTYLDKFDVVEVQVRVARRRRAARRRGRRQRDAVAREACRRAVLRLAAFLRRALALRPARAVQVHGSAIVPMRERLRSSITRSAASCNGSTRAACRTSTIVSSIGDHGESLNEHGEGTHGLFIYDATTRVPFIVRAPYSTARGRRRGQSVVRDPRT